VPLEEYKDNLRTIIAYVRALPKGPAGPCSIVLVSRQRLPPPVRHARRRGRPPTSTEAHTWGGESVLGLGGEALCAHEAHRVKGWAWQITPPPIDHDTWQQHRIDSFGTSLAAVAAPYALNRATCKTHVPQKLTGLISLYTNPVSVLSVLFKPSLKAYAS
jgi:hypothetical protein